MFVQRHWILWYQLKKLYHCAHHHHQHWYVEISEFIFIYLFIYIINLFFFFFLAGMYNFASVFCSVKEFTFQFFFFKSWKIHKITAMSQHNICYRHGFMFLKKKKTESERKREISCCFLYTIFHITDSISQKTYFFLFFYYFYFNLLGLAWLGFWFPFFFLFSSS